jgi:hypothetical protein
MNRRKDGAGWKIFKSKIRVQEINQMGEFMGMDKISRRQFLKTSAIWSASMAGPLFFTGCAVDPVTGKKQLMMVSRD